MNKYIRTIFLLAILIGLFTWGANRTPKPGFDDSRQLPSPGIFSSKTESPYSLKAGSKMARIVDQQGSSIEGAIVTFTAPKVKGCDGYIKGAPPPLWDGTSVTTNAKGEFSYPQEIWPLEGEDNKSVEAEINADGFLKRQTTVGINYGSDNNGQIDLFRQSSITGVLIGPDGKAVADAPIKLITRTQYKNPSSSCLGCFDATAKTDQDGVFIFEKVAFGNHVIKFPGPTSAGCGDTPKPKVPVPFKDYAAWQVIDLKDGQDLADIFLDLRQDYAEISGMVVDLSNRPMPGIGVYATKVHTYYHKHGSSTTSSTIKNTKTDPNGFYTLTNLPPGDYKLNAAYPYEKGKNYKNGDPIDVIIAGKQELGFNLILPRQDGTEKISARQKAPLFPTPLPDDLAPNELMIVDQQGIGIEGATIVFGDKITFTDNKTHQRTEETWSGPTITTGPQGRFTMPDALKEVEGKTVKCLAQIEAQGFKKRGVWQLCSGYVKEKHRIDLLPIGCVSGKVIGTDGQPAKGIIIRNEPMLAYKNPGTQTSSHWTSNIFTDEQGRFEIKNVNEGKHIVRYIDPLDDADGLNTPGIVLQTQGGKDVEELIIDLRLDNCSISGKVLGYQGKPVKKARVRLQRSIKHGDQNSSYMTTYPVFYTSEETNRKGQYKIDRIRPGVYELTAVVEGDRRRQSSKMTIAIGDGQTIDFDLRLPR